MWNLQLNCGTCNSTKTTALQKWFMGVSSQQRLVRRAVALFSALSDWLHCCPALPIHLRTTTLATMLVMQIRRDLPGSAARLGTAQQ